MAERFGKHGASEPIAARVERYINQDTFHVWDNRLPAFPGWAGPWMAALVRKPERYLMLRKSICGKSLPGIIFRIVGFLGLFGKPCLGLEKVAFRNLPEIISGKPHSEVVHISTCFFC